MAQLTREFASAQALSPAASQQAPLWNVGGTMLRHPWVCMIALSMAGVVAGGYYSIAPRVYESSTSLLLETSDTTALQLSPLDNAEKLERSVSTHALVLTSPLIIHRAVKEYDLEELPSLGDVESVAGHIQRRLSVDLKQGKAGVISVHYADTAPEDCRLVLKALADTYERFLRESRQQVDEQTVQQVSAARDDLANQLEEKENEYDAFRANASLVWRDGVGVNLHRERQMEIEQTRAGLVVERELLANEFGSLRNAIERGELDRQAVLMRAVRELGQQPAGDSSADLVVGAEQSLQKDLKVALTHQYFAMLREEQVMQEQFGEGHPDLVSLRGRLESLRSQIWDTQEVTEAARMALSQADGHGDAQETDYVAIYMQWMQDRLAAYEHQISELDDVYELEKSRANQLQREQGIDATYRREMERIRQLLSAVNARLDEMELVRDAAGEKVSMLAPPAAGELSSPMMAKVVGGGLAGGLVISFLLSLWQDRRDATFHSTNELRSVLQLPVIGTIPLMRPERMAISPKFPQVRPALCTVHRYESKEAEAYRSVRTSLLFNTSREQMKVLQVTSPSAGDGKSTLAANLAVTMARSGKRTLLVDADLRRPTIHQLLGIEHQSGLAEIVGGDVNLDDVLMTTPISHLEVVVSGTVTGNPAELLTSSRFEHVLEEMRNKYDVVILDTPPALVVTDASAVAARVDGVILNLRIRRGVKAMSFRASEILHGLGANLVGVVINAVEPKSGFDAAGYDYGYGDPSERTRRELPVVAHDDDIQPARAHSATEGSTIATH
ncbi:MAG: polysaccharide biosynthesis tyrosine autokinase [Pirellulaceae bacterium]|nr:polysaccharide biosynthesis tyrosine autokinase [Planctomycetales bacterium]